MALSRELQLILTLKDEASASLKKFESANEDAIKGSKALAIGLLGAGAAAVGFGTMAVKAASEANADWAKVSQQIKLAGLDVESTRKTVQEFATAQQRLTGASDEYVASVVGRFLPTVKDVNKSMELAKIALDIEASGKMNAESATRVLTLAHLGEIDALKRLLPELKTVDKATLDNMTAQERAQYAVGLLNNEYGGLAEKVGGEFGGQLKRLNESWGDFLEIVGAQIIPALNTLLEKILPFVEETLPAWIARVQEITGWLSQHKEVILVVAGAITGALIPAFLSWGAAMIPVIASMATAALALAPWLIGGALIAGVIAGIIWLVQNWEMVREKAVEIWGAISSYLSGIWQAISNYFIAIWQGISDFFTSILEGISTFLTFWVSLFMGIIVTLLDWLFPYWRDVLQRVLDFFKTIWNTVKDFFLNAFIPAFSALFTAFWEGIKNTLSAMWEAMKVLVKGALDYFVMIFTAISEPLKALWGALWGAIGDKVVSVFEGVKQTIKDAINWVIDKINEFIRKVNGVAQKGASIVGATAPQIPEIPRLAKGGIVTSPTIAQIGEAGPEAVIPLSKAGGLGGTTINIVVNGDVSGDELVDKVQERLMNILRMNSKLAF